MNGIDWAIVDEWFPRIPNIKSMKMSNPQLDPVFVGEGIYKKLPREFEFEILDAQDRFNKYIRYQVRRL
jgi:hypothetical protein